MRQNDLLRLSDILQQSDSLPKLPSNTTNVNDKDKFKHFSTNSKQKKEEQSNIDSLQRVPEEYSSMQPQKV